MVDNDVEKKEEEKLKAKLTSSHFINLLMKTRGCKATDPRDHVFALLGIARGGGKYLPQADYSLSLTEVWTRVAYAWHKVSCRQPLSWLQAIDGSNFRDDIPSWVADWRNGWQSSRLGLLGGRDGASSGAVAGLADCDVRFPDLSTPVTLPLRLEVRGCKLLRIKGVCHIKGAELLPGRHVALINEFPVPYPTTNLSYKQVFRSAALPTYGLRDVFANVPRDQSFWSRRRHGNTTTRPIFNKDAGKFFGQNLPFSAKFHKECHEFCPPNCKKVDICVKRASSTLDGGGVTIRGEEEPRYTDQDLFADFPQLVTILVPSNEDGYLQGRQWFISDDGFMGLVHQITKPGDVIVHFFGATTLFVLRNTNKTTDDGRTIWSFISECYVLGLMNGEVNDGLLEEDVEYFCIE